VRRILTLERAEAGAENENENENEKFGCKYASAQKCNEGDDTVGNLHLYLCLRKFLLARMSTLRMTKDAAVHSFLLVF